MKKMKNVWTTKNQDTIVYPDTMTQLCILTQFYKIIKKNWLKIKIIKLKIIIIKNENKT